MKLKNEQKSFLDLKLDEHNNAIIDLTVLNDTVFLSPVCGNSPVISTEVASYLDNAIKTVPPSLNVSLVIRSNASEKEKEVYTWAIRNYYQNIYRQDIRELIANTWSSLIMFIIGVVVITAMLILGFNDASKLWLTVLEIVGWVFIWESVDKFIFERKRIKKDLRKSESLFKSYIVFEELKNE